MGPRATAPRTSAARPIVLGLAGDSASGKSTLSRGIEHILGPERVRRVCSDDYHRFDRAERAARGVTPLSPGANRLDLMGEHLRRLQRGASVTKPTYDHRTGSFGPEETIAPEEIVLVEGLLPLFEPAAADAIDVSVFLEPEEALRHRWKLERDVFERGYSPADVVAEIRRREADASRYVRPQRDRADLVIRFERGTGTTLSARLGIRPTLPYAPLRELLGSLASVRRPPIRWATTTDARGPISVLEVDGERVGAVGAEIEEVIWSQLHPDDRLQRDLLGVVRRPGGGEERSGSLALAQLLVVAFLVGRFDGSFDL